LLKLTTFYSETNNNNNNNNSKPTYNGNMFDWGTIMVLNWYSSCKSKVSDIQSNKFVFYLICLITALYLYSKWWIWLYQTKFNNSILKLDIGNLNIIWKMLSIISTVLIIISIILIPTLITNESKKSVTLSSIFSSLSGAICFSIILFVTYFPTWKITLIFYFIISIALFSWYISYSRSTYLKNVDNCDKYTKQTPIDEEPLCVSKLNDKDYGGLTFDDENGNLYINNKTISNSKTNRLEKLWLVILIALFIFCIIGYIATIVNLPGITLIAQINKIIIAVIIESINLFALFFYPVYIIVVMVFQRIISTYFNDNTWYAPLMYLIKLLEKSIHN